MLNLSIKHVLMAALALSTTLTVTAQTNYNYSRMQRERLGRGVVAVRQSADTVAVSWRYLSSDPISTAFNVYRNGHRVARTTANMATMVNDCYRGTKSVVYTVRPVVNGKEGEQELGSSYTLPAKAPIGYIDIPLNKPKDGVTPDGRSYSYSPNDASLGDVDGDGNYEIILKWDPSNAHDNAHDGYTGNVLIDCYRLTGQHLWRIDLGRNIRAGAHYTQFQVADYDGDGRAEVIMRTSDGSVDGKGRVIGNASANYVGTFGRLLGRIVTGPEYLTVFSGLTGEALATINYVPERGNLMDWGDDNANRSDRFLACTAYLDGVHPSVVMCRGYYTRAVLAAFDWDGKQLRNRWIFDSNDPECGHYTGQGNHNLRVADVDGDGKDEIIYGAAAIDDDGHGLYSTCMWHGDAMHLTQFTATDNALQVWQCHEKRPGSSLRDARTGKVKFFIPDTVDVGRCMAADIDPTHKGVEMWSSTSRTLYSPDGTIAAKDVNGLSYNMAVWWDGDLLRELLNKNCISKYDWQTNTCNIIRIFDGCKSINGTKAVPNLQADIVGDWREEVLLRTTDNQHLRLFVSTIPTQYRFHTFLEDPVYRASVGYQNTAYNQPTQPGFYIGPDLTGTFRGYNFTK